MPPGKHDTVFHNLLRPLVHRIFAGRSRYNQRYRKWKMRLDPSGLTFRDSAGREEIATSLFRPDPRLAVILAIGASNIANEGDPAGRHEPAKAVYNFNFLDGKCYVARDPLLGATLDRSNVLTRLGDLLVARGAYDRVLLAPGGHSGTYAAEWAPEGAMYNRLRGVLRALRRADLNVTHILWQQGEAEASQPRNEVRGWADSFTAFVDAVRALHVDAPIYVARCTICCCGPSESVRAAQAAVVNPARSILAGPDLDTIGPDQRWDGCHFAISGLDRAASLWFDALAASKAMPVDTTSSSGACPLDGTALA